AEGRNAQHLEDLPHRRRADAALPQQSRSDLQGASDADLLPARHRWGRSDPGPRNRAGTLTFAVVMLPLARAVIGAALAFLGSAPSVASALGESVEEFYRGKQIRLVVGNAVGADYDLGARLLARHLTRHLPGNPAIVVQNMPGAASLGAANFIASVAPKDGTVFGSVSRNLPSQAVIGRAALKVDPSEVQWSGSSGTKT